MVKHAVVALACLFLAGCAGSKEFLVTETAMAEGSNSRAVERRGCVKNFRAADLAEKGTYYSSYQYHKGKSKQEIITNIVLYVMSMGWNIYNVNTQLGVISAIPDVVFEDTLQSSLNVIFNVIVSEERNGIVRVEGSFYSVAGQNISADDAREELCLFLQAATRGNPQ